MVHITLQRRVVSQVSAAFSVNHLVLNIMLQVVIRFLTLNVISEHPAVYWGLATVWLILLVAAVSSLRSLEISFGAKAAWMLLILFLPVFGLGIYALRCQIKGDWSFLKPVLAPPKTAKKIAPR